MRTVRAVVMCLLLVLLFSGIATAQATKEWVFTGEINNDIPFFEPYVIQVTEPGDLVIEVVRESDDLDAEVLLLDNANLILDSNDDRDAEVGGDKLDPYLVYNNIAPGTYQLVVRRARRSTSGVFTATVNLRDVEETVSNYDVTDAALVAAGFPPNEPRAETRWTVIAYYGADTDLEAAIIADMNEFELAGGSSEDVNILVLIDRHQEEDRSNENWTGAKLFEMSQNQTVEADVSTTPTIDTPALAELGEVNMADGELLAQYMTWAIKNYPAQNYVIAFGGHGAGWDGIIDDETSNDNLSLPEIRAAMDTVIAATGTEDKFELLINDACLMASVEYYDVMQDYFEISIGGSELVTNPALDMTQLTQALLEVDSGFDIAVPGTTQLNLQNLDAIKGLGRDLVDTYIERDIQAFAGGTAKYYTMAVTELAQFEAVTKAVEEFATVVNRQPQTYILALSRARANAYTYARFSKGSTHIDLGDFMRQVQRFSGDARLLAASANVLETLSDIRFTDCCKAGSFANERTSYYNIFFPEESNDLQERYFTETGLPQWGQMLRNYFIYSRFEVWSPNTGGVDFHVPDAPFVNITRATYVDAASYNFPVSVAFEVSATNVARGTFLVDRRLEDGSLQRFLDQPLLQNVPQANKLRPLEDQNVWRSGVDSRTVQWAAGAYRVSDGETSNFEYLQRSFDGGGAFFAEGQYRVTEEDEWSDVRISFAPDDAEIYDLRLASLISIDEDSSSVGLFTPQEGAQIRIYRTIANASNTRSSDSTLTLVEGDVIYTIGEETLFANFDPAPNGDYVLSFEVTSFGRGSDIDSIEVPVNNDDINPEIRGQSFVAEHGLVLSVPVSWSDFAIRGDNYFYNSTFELPVTRAESNPFAETIITRAIFYDGDEASLDSILRRYQIFTDAPTDQTIVIGDAFELQGRSTFEFSLTEFRRGIAAFSEARGEWAIVEVEQRSGDTPNELDAAYDLLVGSISFVDDIALSNDAAWALQAIGDEITLPVRTDWQRSREVDLTFFRPNNDALTFAAIATVPRNLTVLNFRQDVVPVEIRQTPRAYNGEEHDWSVTVYETERDGIPVMGRIYLHDEPLNNKKYIFWAETPLVDAEANFDEIFEPMLDGIVIEDLYTIEDFSDTLGITLELPNLILSTEAWEHRKAVPPLYLTNWRSADGTKLIEIYQVYDTDGDLETILERLNSVFGTAIDMDEPEVNVVEDKQILEASATIEEAGLPWEGRYFAWYDEARELGLVIGMRGLEPIDEQYEYLRDSLVYTEGELTLTKDLLEFEDFDRSLGFTADVPALWYPPQVNYTIGSATRVLVSSLDHEVNIFIIEGGDEDARENVRFVGLNNICVTGDDGNCLYEEVQLQSGETAYVAQAYFGGEPRFYFPYFAVYSPDTGLTYVAGAYGPEDAYRQDIFDALLASFQILN